MFSTETLMPGLAFSNWATTCWNLVTSSEVWSSRSESEALVLELARRGLANASDEPKIGAAAAKPAAAAEYLRNCLRSMTIPSLVVAAGIDANSPLLACSIVHTSSDEVRCIYNMNDHL